MTSREPASPTEPAGIALLDQPLDYLLADHLRHRAMSATLRGFADHHAASRADADRVIAHLTQDLRLHHEDEDLDLYPVLRRRSRPADELGPVLARLTEDHRQGEPMIDAIVDALSARPAADPVRIDTGTAELIQAYTAMEHRHRAIENAVVLAIARIRLTRADLKPISRAMKARRGIFLP